MSSVAEFFKLDTEPDANMQVNSSPFSEWENVSIY